MGTDDPRHILHPLNPANPLRMQYTAGQWAAWRVTHPEWFTKPEDEPSSNPMYEASLQALRPDVVKRRAYRGINPNPWRK